MTPGLRVVHEELLVLVSPTRQWPPLIARVVEKAMTLPGRHADPIDKARSPYLASDGARLDPLPPGFHKC
ncbi:MAG: hypothetical protein DMG49_11535 [Acidobacteria bacterium]|nr:MAG: hypothetical protein DMG49_11535 [Acidobacteriota bacterium]